MSDDGNFKGHGGKPGRKSTVISMSAHKNRHAADGGKQTGGKKFSGLTVFDFAPGENGAVGGAADGNETETAAGADSAQVADKGEYLLEKTPNKSQEKSPEKFDALPCENTPFERNVDLSLSLSPGLGLGEQTKAPTGRRFLRWGLEDGGQSEALNPSDIFDEETLARLAEDEEYYQGGRERNRARWQRKSGRSQSVSESFYHAGNGLKLGFDSQRNVRIHCGVAIGVGLLALLLKVDEVGWLALVLSIGFVIFAEYINTAVEHVTDIQANFRYHRSARAAKDTAAAAVLVAAITAALTGVVVFVPRIWALVSAGLNF